MDQVIRFRSAVALAGNFPVLAGVDLDVARGDVVLVRGSNGAGKTSLLRACAGILRVVGGEAQVLGADLVRDQRAVRRRVGLLGHNSALYDEMTALDNVRFGLRAAGARAAAAEPAMQRLGLTGRLAGTRVGSLSAGQRRRVALSILVARHPELWLLDEPHAGLDADYRDLLDEIISSAAAAGTTVLLASHEAERSAPLANRVVTIAGGVVASVAAGPLAAAGPSEPAVARPDPEGLPSEPAPSSGFQAEAAGRVA